MPKRLFLFIALMLLLTSILAIGVRSAKCDNVTIFSQNFDNGATGNQPSWWIFTAAPGEAVPVCFLTVNDTIYHGSSGKSARYVDTVSNSTGYSDVERQFPAQVGGYLEFSFAIMAENPDYFGLYIDNGYFCGANIYFLPNMTLAYYDGDYHYLCPFSISTWYEITMDINVTGNTYDIYVGGLLQAQGAHFNEYGQTWYLNRIAFGENPYGTPSGFIDDVSLIAVGIKPPEPPALLKIVNPLTGDEWFNFTSKDKNIGDTFLANITVSNVSAMATWQVKLTWNSSLLGCINVTFPSDNVLAIALRETNGSIAEGGPDLRTPGEFVCGATLIFDSGANQTTFSGSGVLAQAEFKILQKDAESDISFVPPFPLPDYTFLLHYGSFVDIPLILTNAHYSYVTAVPGDVNMDGTVDMKDVSLAILAFNSFPNTPRWNSLADLDSSGRIDMRDIVIVILNFNHR